MATKKLLLIGAVAVVALATTAGIYYFVTKMAQEQKAQKDSEDSQFTVEEDTDEEGTPVVEEKDILFVVAPGDYRDEELDDSRQVLEAAGYSAVIASKGVSTAKGMLGGSVSVDLDVANVQVADYIAVVFIGGSGAEVYFDDATVQNIAKQAVEQGKVVGAICIAPSILANAGLLEGKQATAYSSEASSLSGHGATYTGKAVTTDGLIVTANGPEAAEAFGEALLALL